MNYYKEIADDRLELLSQRIGAKLEIRKIWPEETGQGFYFRFHGHVHDSELLNIEVVGSYYYGIRNGQEVEEIDLFPFINGKRVSPSNTEHYIWQSPSGLRWDSVEMGYENQMTKEQLLLEEA